MNYTLQYASNFFLNLHRQRDFQKMLVPSSENLALLGNICSLDTGESRKLYKDFLKYTSSKWKHVYIIPGPWEMASHISPRQYQSNIHALHSLTKEFTNTRLLNNSYVTVENTNIQLLGTTLWVGNPHMKYPCMFEYSYIWHKHYSGFINTMGENIKDWHKNDVDYLINTVNSEMRYIVLSHYLPNPVFVDDDKLKNMESTNLDKYMTKPIEVWLAGGGDRHVTGVLGKGDVFAGTNPYTIFSTAKNTIISSYNPQAYVSLKTTPL